MDDIDPQAQRLALAISAMTHTAVMTLDVRRHCCDSVQRQTEQIPALLEELQRQDPRLVLGEVLKRLNEHLASDTDAVRDRESTVSTVEMPQATNVDWARYEELLTRLVPRKSILRRLSRRFPMLEAEEIYEDTVMKILNAAVPVDLRNPVAWFYTQACRVALDTLRRRSPKRVFETDWFTTSTSATLPDTDWVLQVWDDRADISAPERTLRQLQRMIRDAQGDKQRRPWRWAFTVATYDEADRGSFLQFRLFYEDGMFDLAARRTSMSLLKQTMFHSHAVAFYTRGLSGRTRSDDSEDMSISVKKVIEAFGVHVAAMPVGPRLALLLCDLLRIPLGTVVEILHGGQNATDAYPPYGTVGRWRATAKQHLLKGYNLPQASDSSGDISDPIGELLQYLGFTFNDPELNGGH